jgi:hypothetical protein
VGLARRELVGHVQIGLAAELPDEDVREDLDDCPDPRQPGSEPRREEVEYLEKAQDAIDRIARGR